MNSTHERFGGVNAFCLLTTHSGHDQIRREGESKSRITSDARHLSYRREAREPHGPAARISLVAIEAQLGALHKKSWAAPTAWGAQL